MTKHVYKTIIFGAGQIGQILPMDEETAEQFRQLAKKMIKQAEKG